MIELDYLYEGLILQVVADNIPVAPDSTPTCQAYRNGLLEDPSDVPVSVQSAGSTGRYKASFITLTEIDGWSDEDHLVVVATAIIGGFSYPAIIFDSVGHSLSSFTTQQLAQLSGFTIEVISPTDSNGTIEVRQGDAYLAANSRNISIGLTGSLPSLESACTLRVFFGGTKTEYTGAITVNSATDYTLKFDLTGAQTAAMPAGVFSYEVEVTFASTTNKWTPSTGQFTVLSQIG